MTGEELYLKLSKRDYSGSAADQYAQLLGTIFYHVQEPLFKLLEKAEAESKRISLKEQVPYHDEIQPEDLILV